MYVFNKAMEGNMFNRLLSTSHILDDQTAFVEWIIQQPESLLLEMIASLPEEIIQGALYMCTDENRCAILEEEQRRRSQATPPLSGEKVELNGSQFETSAIIDESMDWRQAPLFFLSSTGNVGILGRDTQTNRPLYYFYDEQREAYFTSGSIASLLRSILAEGYRMVVRANGERLDEMQDKERVSAVRPLLALHRSVREECTNPETLQGEPIESIPDERFFSVTSDNVRHCFDAEEFARYLADNRWLHNKEHNPYTRTTLPAKALDNFFHKFPLYAVNAMSRRYQESAPLEGAEAPAETYEPSFSDNGERRLPTYSPDTAEYLPEKSEPPEKKQRRDPAE